MIVKRERLTDRLDTIEMSPEEVSEACSMWMKLQTGERVVSVNTSDEHWRVRAKVWAVVRVQRGGE